MRTRLAVLILAAVAAAAAADRDFDRLVNAVQSHFGVTQTHIPFLGMANFFVKAAHPDGVAGFHLAVFEDLKLSPTDQGAELDRLMRDCSAGLRPLVMTRSRRSNELTYIYVRDSGKTAKLLVVSFERNEATIVEAQIGMDALIRSLREPSHAAKSITSR